MLIKPSLKAELLSYLFTQNINLAWACDLIETRYLISGQLKQKNTWPQWVLNLSLVILEPMWYWSVDTLFWQASIVHNMNVQYQRCMLWISWSMVTSMSSKIDRVIWSCDIGHIGTHVGVDVHTVIWWPKKIFLSQVDVHIFLPIVLRMRAFR